MIRCVAIVAALLVALCLLFVRSEGSLDYIPIRCAMSKYEKYDVFRRAAAQKFEADWNRAHPERRIRLFYEPIGGDYSVKLNTEVVANTVQDVFFVPDYFRYAKQGSLLDLTPYIEKNRDQAHIDSFYPALIEPLRLGGRLYGLPGNLNALVLYYNRTLFRKADVPFPDNTWDWNRMAAAAQKLTVRDTDDRVLQYGLVPSDSLNFILWNGARMWSDDGARCILHGPEAVEGLQYCLDLVFKHRVSPTPKEQQSLGNAEAFQTHRAAMLIGPRWLTTMFWELTDVDWSVAALPLSPRGFRYSAANFNVLGVNARTRNPDIAYAYLRFLTSPEEMRYLVEVGDSIPAQPREGRQDYFLNEPRSPPGANEAYLTVMETAYSIYDPRYTHPDMPAEELRWLYGETLGRAALGEISADEAVRRLAAGLQERLDDYRNPMRTPKVWPYLVAIGVLCGAAVYGGSRALRKPARLSGTNHA